MERDDSTLRDIVITASVADDNFSGKGQNKKRKLHKAQFPKWEGSVLPGGRREENPRSFPGDSRPESDHAGGLCPWERKALEGKGEGKERPESQQSCLRGGRVRKRDSPFQTWIQVTMSLLTEKQALCVSSTYPIRSRNEDSYPAR